MSKADLLKLIRKHCVGCMGGSKNAVADCPSRESCEFWRLRFGTDPTARAAKPTLNRR